jgi:RecA-family ATPase
MAVTMGTRHHCHRSRSRSGLSATYQSQTFLLGELLSTTSRAVIVGPTGLGKTMFGLAVALAIVTNTSFLHWVTKRAGRVLYIDGEMSRRQMKRRLQDAVKRAGDNVGEGLVILSREDFQDMPPLNTKLGQNWLDAFIAAQGPFDLIIFDNVQALLEGNMKDEEQWADISAVGSFANAALHRTALVSSHRP